MNDQLDLKLRIDECVFCGEEAEVDLWDVWPDERAFTIMTCCEGMYEAVLDELQGGSRAPWLRDLFAGYGIDIRQVYADHDYGALRLDFGLELKPIDLKTARAFVAEHHRHNKPPPGWRWGHGAYNGGELVAVSMVGRPVARAIDHTTTVEVNRLCVDPTRNRELVWNACSMLYAEARREAKRRGFKKIITYTLETEAATTLKAVGWKRAGITKGGSWNAPSRPRTDTAPTCRKVRWEAAA